MNKLPDIDVIKSIIAKADEKFTTATDLDKLKHYDDAVSRAYYSVFHIMNAVLFTKGFTFSSHKEVISVFNKEFLKTSLIKNVSFKEILNLFDNRHIGDYETKKFINSQMSSGCIQDAGNIIKICKDYLSSQYKVSKDFWD